MNKQCSTCCFSDICPCRIACDYYTPSTEEHCDDMLLAEVEGERVEYYDAWAAYVGYDAFLFE